MANNGVKSWSTTAANNINSNTGINWDEGMNAAAVNNSARDTMAAVKQWYDLLDGGTVSNGTVGGSANAITLVCAPTVGSLAAGQRYLFALGAAITSTATLQVDSTSAAALQWRGAALAAGMYSSGDIILAVHDGTQFQIEFPPPRTFVELANTTDTSGGAVADLLPFYDASETNTPPNKVTVQKFYDNSLAALTAITAIDNTLDAVPILQSSSSIAKSILTKYIGTGKQTIWIPASAMTARSTLGAASGTVESTTNKVMIKSLDFDAGTNEFAQFAIQMPKGWNNGTVTAQFIWSHAATTTNFAVVWGLQGLALSDDDAQDTAFGTGVEVTDTGGTTNDLYRSGATAAITLGNTPAQSDVVVFQVYRNAATGADTLAIDARLQGVAVFITTNANTDD